MGSECGLSKADIQVREALGWADYQVRSDRAIRRHWQLVCCAFSFCWYHHSHSPPDHVWLPESSECQMIQQEEQVPQRDWGAGEKKERTHPRSTAPLLAKSPAKGESLVEPWILLQRYWRAW